MTPLSINTATVVSADGTIIGYHTLGAGPALIVLGGSLSQADDYLPLAKILAESFAVHVVDRRGRATSGPQGADYDMDKECEDLLAVARVTDSAFVFGHSYGGLIVLETAKRSQQFSRIAVYEPGVSINGSISGGWLSDSKTMLTVGDSRGAFTCMVRQAGYAPKLMRKLPFAISRALLRLGVRQSQWSKMERHLHSQIVEHEQVIKLDNTFDSYSEVTADVLLLAGSKSPSFALGDMETLHDVISESVVEILSGANHGAPTHGSPAVIADRLMKFFA